MNSYELVLAVSNGIYVAVRRNFCFYLDIQDHGLARSLSRRLQDMGLVSNSGLFLPPKSRVVSMIKKLRYVAL